MTHARRQLGLSRAALAELAGVSAGTIHSYEDGDRHPKRITLEKLLQALRLERVQANAIRDGAGFAAVRSLFAHEEGYYFSSEELDAEVETVPWPEFVTNDSFEVVAANHMACAIWGVDWGAERERRSPSERNLLAVANERDFPQRIENWDEILELLASMYKGKGDGPEDVASPSPYFERVLAQFSENDHGFLERLLAAWNRAVPSVPKVRESYRIIWNHLAHGQMNFYCTLTTASERDGLAFNDWIPVDGQTWEALGAIMRDTGRDPERARAELMKPRTRLRE